MQAKNSGFQSLFLKLFEKPEENYSGLEETVRKAVDLKKISTVCTVLETFNNNCTGQTEITDDEAKTAIEKLIGLGFLEMLWQAFVGIICLPMSTDISKTLAVLTETFSIISDNSAIGKSKLGIFLPYLLRDVVGNALHTVHTRLNAAKFLNRSFGENDPNVTQQVLEIKQQKTIHDEMGHLISSAGDFELQAAMLELVFRLIQEPERKAYVQSWFSNNDVQDAFCCIEDAEFEGGCRKFLNKLNASLESKRSVYSFPCKNVQVGDKQIRLAKDDTLDNFWVDFNLVSRTIKFFIEEEDENNSEESDILWDTVAIKPEDIWDHRLEKTPHRLLLRMKFKNPDYRLAPSIQPCGQRTVNISFPLTADLQTFRQLLDRMNVAPPIVNPTPYTPSPKASICINTIHVANRQVGTMKIVPPVASKPPSVLMEEDGDIDQGGDPATASPRAAAKHDNGEINHDSRDANEETGDTMSTEFPYTPPDNSQPLCSKDSMDAPSIGASQPSGNSPAVEVGNLTSVKRTIATDDSTPSARDTLDNKHRSSLEQGGTPSKDKNDRQATDNLSDASDKPDGMISGKDEEKATKKMGSKSKIADVGNYNSSSSTSSGAGRKRRTVRTKSPLPVVVVQRRGKTSSEEESENKPPEKKAKKYPSAFNVDKRMERKRKQAEQSSQSMQDIKKKVFGKQGTSFAKKSSLHPLTPSRILDPRSGLPKEKELSSVPVPSYKKRHLSDLKFSSTSELDSGDEIEVIQDSLPLADSPTKEEERPRRNSADDILSKTKSKESRLVHSDTEVSNNKHKPVRETKTSPKPKRIFKQIRKGGLPTRSSLSQIRTGFYAESSSSSGTDWPGPDKEPGPVSPLDMIPKSMTPVNPARGRRKTKNASLTGRGRGKRTSISPGLNAIREENTPDSVTGKSPTVREDGRLPNKKSIGDGASYIDDNHAVYSDVPEDDGVQETTTLSIDNDDGDDHDDDHRNKTSQTVSRPMAKSRTSKRLQQKAKYSPEIHTEGKTPGVRGAKESDSSEEIAAPQRKSNTGRQKKKNTPFDELLETPQNQPPEDIEDRGGHGKKSKWTRIANNSSPADVEKDMDDDGDEDDHITSSKDDSSDEEIIEKASSKRRQKKTSPPRKPPRQKKRSIDTKSDSTDKKKTKNDYEWEDNDRFASGDNWKSDGEEESTKNVVKKPGKGKTKRTEPTKIEKTQVKSSTLRKSQITKSDKQNRKNEDDWEVNERSASGEDWEIYDDDKDTKVASKKTVKEKTKMNEPAEVKKTQGSLPRKPPQQKKRSVTAKSDSTDKKTTKNEGDWEDNDEDWETDKEEEKSVVSKPLRGRTKRNETAVGKKTQARHFNRKANRLNEDEDEESQSGLNEKLDKEVTNKRRNAKSTRKETSAATTKSKGSRSFAKTLCSKATHKNDNSKDDFYSDDGDSISEDHHEPAVYMDVLHDRERSSDRTEKPLDRRNNNKRLSLSPNKSRTKGTHVTIHKSQGNMRSDNSADEDDDVNISTENYDEAADNAQRKQLGKRQLTGNKPKESLSSVMGEDEETLEMAELRKLCQSISAVPSLTPSMKTPVLSRNKQQPNKSQWNISSAGQQRSRKRSVSANETGKSCDRDDGGVEGNESVVDEVEEPKRKTSRESPANPSSSTPYVSVHLHNSSRKTTMSERFGRIQEDSPSNKSLSRRRLDDSGIGLSPGSTEPPRRTCALLTDREGRATKSTPKGKGRRMGELQVTTFSKTPVTPRTYAIMKRIDEEEEENEEPEQPVKPNVGQPKRRFFNWTSSGPSRIEDPQSDNEEEDITDEEDDSRQHSHNPHIKPRKLFPEDAVGSRQSNADDELGYESGAEEEDAVNNDDMSSMITGLGGSLVKAMRRKRQNMQRFSDQTMEKTMDFMNRYWEKDQLRRDKLVKTFRQEFKAEVTCLESAIQEHQKAEEQFLARLDQHAKMLATQRIIQENKIKSLQEMCTGFEKQVAQESQKQQQIPFNDKLRTEISQMQKRFILDMQKQDRAHLRRSLETILDTTVL